MDKKRKEIRRRTDDVKKNVELRLERTKKNYTEQKTKLEDAARRGVSFKVSLPDQREESVNCGCKIF